jgi:short-subunit dehydrogenase
MATILIVGITSDIARSAAIAFGLNGWDVEVAGRDAGRTSRVAVDLSVRLGKSVPWYCFDAHDPESRSSLWPNLPSPPDALLCAVGYLGDQMAARSDIELMQRITEANYMGLLPLLSQAADTFEQRRNGLIIAISSVAGDRGRASNYTYGAAKAGLTAYLSGLRQRLYPNRVQVLTVKPGFVRTAMTDGMSLPKLLTATPDHVATDILHAVERKYSVIYSWRCWRVIMLLVKIIPEIFFKKLST